MITLLYIFVYNKVFVWERWPSGLRRTLGKRVNRNVSQVQILSSPPNETSARESDGERRAKGAQEEEKGRKRRRVATKAEGDGTEK